MVIFSQRHRLHHRHPQHCFNHPLFLRFRQVLCSDLTTHSLQHLARSTLRHLVASSVLRLSLARQQATPLCPFHSIALLTTPWIRLLRCGAMEQEQIRRNHHGIILEINRSLARRSVPMIFLSTIPSIAARD